MTAMKRTAYVDTSIGTVGDELKIPCHGGGKTYPGACMPSGMVQLSPDTISGGDNTSGYNYCDTTIEGFSFNHLGGVGWYGDLGNVQIMPVVGSTDLRSGSNAELPFKKGTEGWKSAFTHETERTRAGYYAVHLDRYGIDVEATVSVHTGYLRLSYPAGDDCGLIFNFSRRMAGKVDFQHIEVVSDTCLEGWLVCTPKGGGWGRGAGNISYTLYFTIELSKPMQSWRFFEDETYMQTGCVCEGEDLGLDARFCMADGEVLVLRCGISYTDLEGARSNLRSEGIGFDFDAVAQRADDAWEQVLSCVQVEGCNETDLTLFYTCLYHALLDPRIAVDADGRFRMADGIHDSEGRYTQRTLFSGWDVYRSEFPLLTLIRPDMVSDTVNSLLTVAKSTGTALPRFEINGVNMIAMNGDAGVIMAADAYCKGIRDFDTKALYDLSIASARLSETLDGRPFTPIRLDHLREHREVYLEHGYEPGTLSVTLGLLVADYALAQLAKDMGHEEDARFLLERAARYGENYNPATGFMGPRDMNGQFIPLPKNEFDETGCTESNILQQSWEVPHDIQGLFALFGRERGLALLEEFFEKADFSALWNNHYNHSNEPCHNLTHYFNEMGLPHRTQYWTRRVQKEAYRLGAFGFCGNEDVGQLSGWYVLSAMGFAQICPAQKRYQINTPLFRKVEFKLSEKYHARKVSDRFTVVCDQDPLEYPYIEKLLLNGEVLDRWYVTYEEITNGGELKCVLSREPVKA